VWNETFGARVWAANFDGIDWYYTVLTAVSP
jgi:hypothetical protein